MTDNLNINLLLLPPQTNSRKTLVLDLDETLVHSQFIPFDNPSDVVIKIYIDNEAHDIHVMIRPGVKELLEAMEKYYEIVIFTASVSKYADPLLNIIDNKGFCPYRLFREHCTIINTTFVKDLQRLGRDLKDVVIVDNSPLSYILHPDNGLPVQTWFEDKSDRELFKIIPILEFLSNVFDVRDYISKIVDGNEINYDRALKMINEFSEIKNVQKNNNPINRIIASRNKENNKNLIVNNLLKKNNNIFDIKNKDNFGLLQDKLIELNKKNIIASVNRPNIMNGNTLTNKQSGKNTKNNKKSKPKIKIQITGSDSNFNHRNKNLVSYNNQTSNNNLQSNPKNVAPLFTKKIFSNSSHKLQKNVKRACSSAVLDNNLYKQPTDYQKQKTNNNVKRSQIIKHIYNTPKIQKLARIFNKSNKTIDIYPLSKNNKNLSTSQTFNFQKKNNIYHTNPISKSQTKNNFMNPRTPQILNKDNNINLNGVDNRVIKNNNKILYKNKENQIKSFNTNTNISSNHRKQKSYNNFVSYQKNSKKIKAPATPKNIKIIKNSLPFSERYPQKSLNNISNNFDSNKTNRETNQMKYRTQNNREQSSNTINKKKNNPNKNKTLYDNNTVRHKTAYNGKKNNRSKSMKKSGNIENNKFSKSLKFEITEILHKRGISIIQKESPGKAKKLVGDKKGVITNRKSFKK